MNYYDGQGFPVSLQGLMEDIAEYVSIYLDFDELVDPLRDAVEKLPPEDRRLVNLVYLYEGVRRPDREVAAYLGISQAPFRREKNRVVRRLANVLFVEQLQNSRNYARI